MSFFLFFHRLRFIFIICYFRRRTCISKSRIRQNHREPEDWHMCKNRLVEWEIYIFVDYVIWSHNCLNCFLLLMLSTININYFPVSWHYKQKIIWSWHEHCEVAISKLTIITRNCCGRARLIVCITYTLSVNFRSIHGRWFSVGTPVVSMKWY